MKKIISIILICLICSFCLGLTLRLPGIQVPESSVLYDVNGRVIKGLSEQNSVSVSLDEISPHFLKAIIAVEDKHFYTHHGIDIGGLLRAVFTNIKERKIVAGGSTITQQTAKNLFLGNERTFTRKIKELYYAFQLERSYSKDEILNLYCNSIYFGEGAYGVEVASRTYFDKNASDLSLAQAALLAGIPQWPGGYDPYEHPDAAKQRQEVVLQRMLEDGVIDADKKKEALAEELVYSRSQYISSEAPYFTAMVKDYLREKYGDRRVYQGGLQVYTTLDLNMQIAANQAYQEGMKNRDKDLQAALIALDVKNSQIRAMIGGRDFVSSNYNRVFADRQPGSTFKPFVYSLAIDKGYTPASMMMCEEIKYPMPDGSTYQPTDYGKDYHGKEFTLKEALMISDNVIAVRLTDAIGVKQATRHAESFGFTGLKTVLSLPLGSNEVRPIDLAAGYSVFGNQGIYSAPSYILKVTDQNGTVLEENKTAAKRVISQENAYIITDMLTGVLEPGGTGSHLKALVGGRAAAKTGTTDDYNDAWFVGYTPQICCAVWVGYDQGKNVNLAGGVAAGPIWANFMGAVSKTLPEGDFEKLSDIDVMSICLDTGQIAVEGCPRQIQMAFIKGTEPEELCWEHAPVGSLDLPSNKRHWWNFW